MQSPASRRLVVSGPGTGKTTLFRMVLEEETAEPHERLILTFINNLAHELRRDLGHLARVYTFHGYCHFLLRRQPELRGGLGEAFLYFPKLVHIVKSDWEALTGEEAPQFVRIMQRLERGPATEFYVRRGNYYQAVGFDDSVFRVHEALVENPDATTIRTVLVDEYQDFNQLEVSLIDLLSGRGRLLVAGDDDQALYSQLRGSDARFIREIHGGGEYVPFMLPFCMRCTQVIVEAVGDLVREARRRGHLAARIDKPYLYYPPSKGGDSQAYPRIKLVQTTIQRQGPGNYFGRYIAEEIGHIPPAQIEEARAGRFPTVLVIAADPYRWQIVDHLRLQGHTVDTSNPSEPFTIERSDGLRILKANAEANLGWRVMMELDQPQDTAELIRRCIQSATPLGEMVPADFRERILREAAAWREPEAVQPEAPDEDVTRPTIRVTSFEGAKGLSAQHVFIAGLHQGELPRNPNAIQDLEICRFLVALTRTRKQCHLLYTTHFANVSKRGSIFLRWLQNERLDRIRVDREYWRAPF